MRIAETKQAFNTTCNFLSNRQMIKPRLVTIATRGDNFNNQRCLYFDKTSISFDKSDMEDITRSRNIMDLRLQIETKKREIEIIGDATKVTAQQIMRENKQKAVRPPKVTPAQSS
jgi:hypothetical protein